jgi:hypothetical protein
VHHSNQPRPARAPNGVKFRDAGGLVRNAARDQDRGTGLRIGEPARGAEAKRRGCGSREGSPHEQETEGVGAWRQQYTNPAAFWSYVVEPDYVDALKKPGDLRCAFHCAISLFHRAD